MISGYVAIGDFYSFSFYINHLAPFSLYPHDTLTNMTNLTNQIQPASVETEPGPVCHVCHASWGVYRPGQGEPGSSWDSANAGNSDPMRSVVSGDWPK